MKIILASILILFASLASSAQNITVMADTNGLLKSPLAFTKANRLATNINASLTNTTFKSAVTLPDITADRVAGVNSLGQVTNTSMTIAGFNNLSNNIISAIGGSVTGKVDSMNGSATNLGLRLAVTLPDITADRIIGVNSLGQITNSSMSVSGFNNLSNNIMTAVSGSVTGKVASMNGLGTNETFYGPFILPDLTVSRAAIIRSDGAVTNSVTTSTEISLINGLTYGLMTNLDYRIPNYKGNGTNLVVWSGLTNMDLTASRVMVTDANKRESSSAVTAAELLNLSGVTGGIQTNLDAKIDELGGFGTNLTIYGTNILATGAALQLSSDMLVTNTSGGAVDFYSLGAEAVVMSIGNGGPVTLTQPNINYPLLMNGTANRVVVTDGSKVMISSSITDAQLNFLSGTTVNIQTNLDYRIPNYKGNGTNLVVWSGFTNNDNTASRALVTDANKKYVSSVTTSAELALLSGLTYGVQTNLDWRVANFSGTATGLTVSGTATGIVQSVNGLTKNALVIAVGSTGVSPNLSTTAPDTININIPVSASGVVGVLSTTDRTTFLAVTGKVDQVSGNATNIIINGQTNFDLTASTVPYTDANKKLTSSVTTSTELGYVNGVTSAIQAQIDSKQSTNLLTLKGDLPVFNGSAWAREGVTGSDGDVFTKDSSRSNGVKWAAPSGGISAITNWVYLAVASPKLPASNPARIDNGENNTRLLFDAATDQSGTWQFMMPDYGGSIFQCDIMYSMTSATSGNVVWNVAVMAVASGASVDANTDSYDTVNATTNAVAGTAGYILNVATTLASQDSVAAGNFVKIKISRDADNTSDTATGDAEIIAIKLKIK